MPRYAYVQNNKVKYTFNISEDQKNSGIFGSPSNFIEISDSDNVSASGSFVHNEKIVPPQPFPSWEFDGNSWISPVKKPLDGQRYTWNEETQSWDPVTES